MKLNEHERARPNIAGLTSPVQQAEMRLLLAGKWPPLKPLPVFKYDTDEYRASIDFDKTRGEWVCRKTSLPSNKIEELRGGLTEITMALPRGQEEVFARCAAADQQEQELEKDATRRLQAMLEWRENSENGAHYSELRGYLSESQQDEIDDIIRLTLTARQLQFNPKNVAYVFDALSKAGGKLATLIEIARRNKTQQGAELPAKVEIAVPDAERHVPVVAIHLMRDRRLQMRTTPASRACVELGGANGCTVLNISETGMAVAAADPLVIDDDLPRIRLQLPSSEQSIEMSAQIVWLGESKKNAGIRFVDLTAEAHNQISDWIASEKSAPKLEGLTPAPAESFIPATQERFPEEEPIESAFPEREQSPAPDLLAYTASQARKIVRPEILDESPLSLVEDFHEKVRRHTPVGYFAPQIRTDELSADRMEESPSHIHGLEISGFQIAAVMFLFAVISLAVGLTVGRGPLGNRLQDAQKSFLAVDATSPALPDLPGEMTSRTSTPPVANTLNTPVVNAPAPEPKVSRSESASAQSFNARPGDPTTRVRPTEPSSAITPRSLADSGRSEASPERKGSTGLIARNAWPPLNSQPAYSPRAVSPTSGAPANPVPRKPTLATRAAPRVSSPSTVLVTGPGDGSKPFRLILPQKTIAASSSFAMASQLSVLVAPEPGPAPALAREPARLQAGELVSFVWPRYPKPGDRHGSSETVKVRTTIGELGQVLDVKHVSGSISLLPAAMSAIRLWRYKPTLLNSRPVQAQQDVTIEFRPPQRLSRTRTRHRSHN